VGWYVEGVGSSCVCVWEISECMCNVVGSGIWRYRWESEFLNLFLVVKWNEWGVVVWD
jgi:hypothetical protein